MIRHFASLLQDVVLQISTPYSLGLRNSFFFPLILLIALATYCPDKLVKPVILLTCFSLF